jgi:hypothetical protein
MDVWPENQSLIVIKKVIMKLNQIIVVSLLSAALGACSKALDIYPDTYISTAKALTGEANLTLATSGNYSFLINSDFMPAYYYLNETSNDNIEATAVFDPGGTRQFAAYSYAHYPTMLSATRLYTDAYRLIRGANNIISVITDEGSETLRRLKGENLFLRALAYMTLVKTFGRPFMQNNGSFPAVTIVENQSSFLERPAVRNTVKEVYELMISDLLKAESLLGAAMTNNAFASKYSAQALLSQLYLDMGNNEQSIIFAEKVINAGNYALVEGNAYISYFSSDHSADRETIFCIKNLDGTGGGFFYYNLCYTGDRFAAISPPLFQLLNECVGDLRQSFCKRLQTSDGQFWNFTTKFIQNPSVNISEQVSSPPILRLAQMYLNRAEANAKLGNGELVLADVNRIRRRAGLSGNDLYSKSNMRGRGSLLQIVIDERRLEFAFEAGMRRDDLLRNNLPMRRDYGKAGIPGTNLTVLPGNPRVVYFLPLSETDGRTNMLEQNP